MARPKTNNLTHEDELNIVRLYLEEGLGTPTIARMYNVKNYTISYLLDKKYKVPKRSNKVNSRKFFADFNYFNVINTPEKAYWLGFIYADGFVTTDRNQVGIVLKRSDREHLERFKEHIQATYEVHDYETGEAAYKPGTPYSRIIIEHEQLKADLIRHGVYERKSPILKFPTTVPNELIYHWLRGYMDGDGSITHNTETDQYMLRFIGTKEVIQGIQKLLGVEHLELGKRKEDNKNNWALDIGGHIQIIPMLDKIYEDSTIYLQRKYIRYVTLKNSPTRQATPSAYSLNC